MTKKKYRKIWRCEVSEGPQWYPTFNYPRCGKDFKVLFPDILGWSSQICKIWKCIFSGAGESRKRIGIEMPAFSIHSTRHTGELNADRSTSCHTGRRYVNPFITCIFLRMVMRIEIIYFVRFIHPLTKAAERFQLLYKEKCAVEKLCVEKQEVNELS